MAQMIEFPPYEHVGNFKADIESLVIAVDATRDPELDLVYRGFYIACEYRSGDFSRYSMVPDFYEPGFSEFPQSQTIPFVRELLATAQAYEAARCPSVSRQPRGQFMSLQRRALPPEEPARQTWHSGDSPRYLLALGAATEFAVGEAELPKDFAPEPHDFISLEAKANNQPMVGNLLQHILITNGGVMPEGLEVIRPKLGDLVRIDWRQAHQSPPNPLKQEVDRVRLLSQVTYS